MRIGIGFVAMAALRRLSTPALAVLGAAIAVLAEKITDVFGWGSETTPVLAMLLLVPGRRGSFVFGYPALPWLAIMLFGWVFGRSLLRAPDPRTTSRRLALAGLALLALFGVVRGCNGYGNMGLPREGSTLGAMAAREQVPTEPLLRRARARADGAPPRRLLARRPAHLGERAGGCSSSSVGRRCFSTSFTCLS